MTARSVRRVVVVGGSIAGLTACDTLRDAGFDGDLTIVGDERHAPYSRPALSKALLHDLSGDASPDLPAPEHGATEILGTGARSLDAERRRVVLDDGTELPYDGLVIATGARARRLTVSASETTLRTLDDAVELRRRASGRPSVLVVGGGALGMEVASGFRAHDCEVTLVTRGRPMTRQLGPWLATLLGGAAERAGVRVVPTSSARLTEDGDRLRAVLADGSVLDADLVITAAGDVPNVEWLVGSGLLGTDGGLAVDSRGRVRPDVVAAGDVTAFPAGDGVRRVPLWTSAIDLARVAATSLLRGDEAPELRFQPYFWTEQFGVSLKACGPLPVQGDPELVDGTTAPGPALLRWERGEGQGTAVAVDHRLSIPRLRRLAAGVAA